MPTFQHSQLLSSHQLTRSDLEILLKYAQKFEKNLQTGQVSSGLQNKIVASLFYEPSTRTRLSFETAVLRLGGQVISAVGMKNTSFQKGETLFDAIKTIENYADIIILRHPEQGAAQIAARASQKPLINAGDGAGEHPTQALVDLYTIYQKHQKIDQLTIGLLGDLKYGRTIHSLLYVLSKFNVKLILISPEKLKLPSSLKDFLQNHKVYFEEIAHPESVIEQLDVLYITRIQKERFDDITEYASLQHAYHINPALIKNGRDNLIVLHPLPRVNELSAEVDNLPQAAYFQQVKNSVPVRMALLDLISQTTS